MKYYTIKRIIIINDVPTFLSVCYGVVYVFIGLFMLCLILHELCVSAQ